MTKALQKNDPAVLEVLKDEQTRQEEGLELIASENVVSQAVMDAQGSVLTNKYAEGYPGKRYYGGCEVVDRVESLAIERVCKLFGAAAANVQPHSGSQANMGSYLAVMKPGDKVLGMSLVQGGHLTHGSPVNFSGRLFQVESYGLDPKTERLDYDQVREQAKRVRPKVIVAGASAYSRIIDFEIFGQIAKEVEAHLIVDMAHIAGLVAVGLHPSPIPHATYTTSTTHKTLRGPRGGLILCRNAEDLKAVNSQIFPGIQGGPLMHVIAAKAVSFGEALRPSFKVYQQTVLDNSMALAAGLMKRGLRLVSGGTDNHLALIDLTSFADGSITGKDAETWMGLSGITVNKNTIPNEKRSPFVTSGIRIGTPAITSRGLKPGDIDPIAGWIVGALESRGDAEKLGKIRAQVHELCKRHPVYGPEGSLV